VSLPYLFQLVHQGHRIIQAVVIGIVKLFGQYLVHDPVFACPQRVSLPSHSFDGLWHKGSLHQYVMAGLIWRNWFARLT